MEPTGRRHRARGDLVTSERNQSTDALQISSRLLHALVVHMDREARRLGLAVRSDKLDQLGNLLLQGPGSEAVGMEHPSGHILRESHTLETYTTENLESHDYLRQASQEMRRRLGQHVTPSIIVKYILHAAHYNEESDILDKRVVDPACGSGIFLLEAVRIYLAALRRSGAAIETWYPRVQTLFLGLDVDPLACLYTRFNLGLLLAPAILYWSQANPDATPSVLPVYCLDTLSTIAAQMGPLQLFSYAENAPSLKQSFDLVIGNPPYFKLGRVKRGYEKAFRDSLYGHPNAYGLFLHAGLEMLRAGGVLAYIIPRSMLSGLYFKNLRQFVEQQAVLQEVTLMAERKKVFEGVLQGTMILVCRRRPAPDAPIKTAIVHTAPELESYRVPCATVARDQVVRRLNGVSVWFVSDTRRTYSILDKVIDGHPLLSSASVGCVARTGTIVWNRVKSSLRARPEAGCLPLVWATDVDRYAFSFGGAGSARPSYLQLTERTRSLVNRGLCLLVQRVTADEQPHRLVACVPQSFCDEHPEGYLVENHLNVVQSLQGATLDLYYLLAVLCSDVIEFFFRTMNGNTQVSATELNLMPIPRTTLETQIAESARALQASPDPAFRLAAEQQLNQCVARAYSLAPDDLSYIQKTLREAHPNDHR